MPSRRLHGGISFFLILREGDWPDHGSEFRARLRSLLRLAGLPFDTPVRASDFETCQRAATGLESHAYAVERTGCNRALAFGVFILRSVDRIHGAAPGAGC